MIKHSNIKTFQEKLKNEEMALNKLRVSIKPEVHEISSMYDKVSAKLDPVAANLALPSFITSYE
jgi:hypothetical protein